MPSEYDAGKAALDALIEWTESNPRVEERNEAATRLHLIDGIVVDVLRWPRSAVRPEETTGSGFIDYALGSPGTKLIVEAKRKASTSTSRPA